MKLLLSSADVAKIERLEKTRKTNFRFTSLLSRYLNLFSDAVKYEYLQELVEDTGASAEEAFCAALTVILGLDTQNEEDRLIIRKYLPGSIKCLDSFYYRSNPYYRTVSFEDVKKDEWELKQLSVAPYEAFVYNDPILLPDYTELPRIGFFRESFSFPAVLQNGREWMTLMPNETATLENAVKNCFGNVVTYGLGLGYFPFMASAKENVKSVTVVEKDKKVIELFTQNILPLFPNKDKISVVCEDAFYHAKSILPKTDCDYVLADIWHDAGDGLPMYLEFRRLAKLTPRIKWEYWLEETMISYLRWPLFGEIYRTVKSGEDPKLFGDMTINGFTDIQKILSFEFIKDNACETGKFLNIWEETKQ
ncbi:MAG: hypothetical protein IKT37_07075 [Clostridia bacterium]|nr:hypothetical protein [Clostridia bacterium]